MGGGTRIRVEAAFGRATTQFGEIGTQASLGVGCDRVDVAQVDQRRDVQLLDRPDGVEELALLCRRKGLENRIREGIAMLIKEFALGQARRGQPHYAYPGVAHASGELDQSVAFEGAEHPAHLT